MTLSVLQLLIEMLEEASEGSHRLDCRMHLYLGRSSVEYPGIVDPPRGYTRSIDAALTLVPHGAVWHLQTDYGGLNRANVGPAGRPSASIYNATERELFVQADGETPALALCIAALKARLA